MRLILASNSPRRRELLSRLTSDFSVVPSRVDEVAVGTPEEQAVEIARAKAHDVGRREHGVIIGADTIIVIDGDILGKPASRAHAREILERLSGRDHSVLTGLCLWDTESNTEKLACEETRVTFRAIDNEEIDAYLDTDEYLDKAGAYGIQGAAAKLISGIEGEYTNVMGLPLCRLTLLLREMGVRL